MNIIDDFFGWLEGERNYSAHTINSYKRDIADFLSWQDITPEVFMPDKLTRNAVMDWAIWRFDNGLKATTINRGMAAMRTLARWMQKSGIAEGNALKLLRQFKPPKRLPTFVPDTRMDNVVESCCVETSAGEFLRLRNAVVVLLIYTSGLRLSEVTGANVEDLARDYSAIRVMGKGNKMRIQLYAHLITLTHNPYGAIIPRQILDICPRNLRESQPRGVDKQHYNCVAQAQEFSRRGLHAATLHNVVHSCVGYECRQSLWRFKLSQEFQGVTLGNATLLHPARQGAHCCHTAVYGCRLQTIVETPYRPVHHSVAR